MIFSTTKFAEFQRCYSKLKIYGEVNEATGGIDWVGINSQKKKVLSFNGRKCSILLRKKLFTTNIEHKVWLEEKLTELAAGDIRNV